MMLFTMFLWSSMDYLTTNHLGDLGRSADSVTVDYAVRLSQQFSDAQVGSMPAVHCL